MVSVRKNNPKHAEDYAGGEIDFPRESKDLTFTQKSKIDNDMGKYGRAQSQKGPKSLDDNYKRQVVFMV